MAGPVKEKVHSGGTSWRKMAKVIAMLGVLVGTVGAIWLGLRIAERNRLLPSLPSRPAATLPEASVILAADGSDLALTTLQFG
ncbi:MAG: hypothetical protein O2899_05735, partial [Bacteroidetes bacterium]|nr:hypothetical protein [Bacteroidota bacterium]